MMVDMQETVRYSYRLRPGATAQRALLEEEGVVFLPDGRVDMARCGWLK